MKTLYLTYDGLTDPLGRSQILPYLVGLAAKGHSITIVSFEKKLQAKQIPAIQKETLKAGIHWIPLSYTKFPPVLSTMWDLYQLRKTTFALCRAEDYQLVHCRSYITSITGASLKKKFGLRFIFDMRGFWADERVDGGIWNLKNPVFRLVYHYFKRKEKMFLKEADHIISLTFKARELMQQWGIKNTSNPASLPISVIPTCVDRQHFSPERLDPSLTEKLRQKLGFTTKDFVLAYIGSLGTWYLVREMVHFFSVLKSKQPQARFLILTPDPALLVTQYLKDYELDPTDVTIRRADREEVPTYISLANWTLFFIQPFFSKAASAPTKMAEINAMRKPILYNLGVGDMDRFQEEFQPGFGIRSLDEPSFAVAADYLLTHPEVTVADTLAAGYFDLEKAIDQLDLMYRSL